MPIGLWGQTQRLDFSVTIDERECTRRVRGPSTWHVRERSIGRRDKIRDASWTQDTLDDRHGTASHLQRFEIEGHSEQDVAEHVQEMAGRKIPSRTGAAKHDLALTGLKRLHHDLRLV